MKASLYQEFYKLSHRKVSWITPSLMIVFMLIMAVGMGKSSTNLLIMTCYNSGQWILVVLAIVGSTLFSSEYQNNAILTVLYKAKNRVNVYLSKLVVMIVYTLLLHLLAIVLTVLLSYTPLTDPVSWMEIYQYNETLLSNMLMTTGVDLVASLLMIGITFLLSCWINSNSTVITVSVAIVFFGPYATTSIIRSSPNLASFVKWNPLNMTNLTNQYFNYNSYHPTTLLSNQQLMLGTIFYLLLFLGIGYEIFRKKSF